MLGAVVPRILRAHTFVVVALVAVLIGAGLRFIPSSAAAPAAGSATACTK